MFSTLLESRRGTKRTISIAYDVIALAFSFYVAICLRLGRTDIELGVPELATLGITIAVSIAAFIRLGLYRAILRFMAHQALISIALGVLVSAAALATSSFFLNAWVPRSVPIIYAFAALFFLGTPRLLIRHLLLLVNMDSGEGKESVIIYGAGQSGFQLANALQGSKYKVLTFVDDDPHLHGRLIHGHAVKDSGDLPNIIAQKSIKHVLLALDGTSRAERAAIVSSLEPLEVSVKTIPAMSDILSGKARIQDITDVEIEDLLGRDPIAPDESLMDACITGKNVLVTGAGGSIGSELCRQILKHTPATLVLFERCEYNLYRLEQELSTGLRERSSGVRLIAILGSIQNRDHLEDTFTTFKINTIYHAAAYKHVPLIEHNLIEGVKNNVFGTWHCAEAAISSGVDSFVLVSTDKAVRPTNVMGASKRLAELVLQGLANEQNTTRFTMVRFGNVLGSSGSVVPLFRRQISSGGPITVTHPDIIRYFMTIPEAAELVIQAGSMGQGGDVFVLDMGEPVKILDLAKRMIHLSRLTLKDEANPAGDIAIQFTGLRPGEKLFEELLIGENVSGTDHARILRAEESSLTWDRTEELLKRLSYACELFACDTVRDLLLSAPTGYQPGSEQLYDNSWVTKTEQRSNTTGQVIALDATAARKTPHSA